MIILLNGNNMPVNNIWVIFMDWLSRQELRKYSFCLKKTNGIRYLLFLDTAFLFFLISFWVKIAIGSSFRLFSWSAHTILYDSFQQIIMVALFILFSWRPYEIAIVIVDAFICPAPWFSSPFSRNTEQNEYRGAGYFSLGQWFPLCCPRA